MPPYIFTPPICSDAPNMSKHPINCHTSLCSLSTLVRTAAAGYQGSDGHTVINYQLHSTCQNTGFIIIVRNIVTELGNSIIA